MKIKLKKRWAAALAANAAALIAVAALTAAGRSISHPLTGNTAAERWKAGGDGSFSQTSVFLTEEAGFRTRDLSDIRGRMLNELKKVSYDAKKDGEIAVAYSAPFGKEQVKCDLVGRSDAEITAVGGKFFFFRDFRLLDGAFFDDDSLAQDAAVVDKELAWRLYGASDVSGKKIYVNGATLYIAGVIDIPASGEERDCAGDIPRAYVSYEAASAIRRAGGGAPSDGATAEGTGFDEITCYETVLPEPVENLAEQTVNKVFSERYKGEYSAVVDTGRFDPKKRAKAYGKLYKTAIKDDSIVYPFWENGARVAEFKLSRIYAARRAVSAIPAATAVWLAIKGLLLLRRNKLRIKRAASRGLGKLFSRRKKAAPVANDTTNV